MKEYFQTNIFEFMYFYIISTGWIFKSLTIIAVITLALTLITVSSNKYHKSKLSKHKSEFSPPKTKDPESNSPYFCIFPSVLFSIIFIAITTLYWTIEADESDKNIMRSALIKTKYVNASLNQIALKGYEYYIQDKKIKSWEVKAFNDGLDRLKSEDIKYQVQLSLNGN
jgi:hypothetical protein